MAVIKSGVPIVPCWIQSFYRAKPFISKMTIHFLPSFKSEEIQANTKKDHYLLVSEKKIYDIIKLSEKHMAVLN